MPTLVQSYPVDTGGSDNTDTLVTSAFTPVNGEVLVVKMATWDTSSTMNAPTATVSSGSTPTFTSRVVYNPGSAKPWTAIYTAVVSGSPVGVQVSATHSATASMHSMVVERWGSATLGSPVASGQATDDGQPLATLTTTGANSVISAVDADWFANTGDRTYRGSGVEVYAYQQSGSTCHYYWYAPVATAGLTQFGMTTPDGQSYALAGIELLNADSGTEQELGLASSTDTVRRLGRSLGRADDSGTSYGLGRRKAKPLGVGGSTGEVHALGRTKSVGLGLASEINSVASLGRAKSKTLGTVSGSAAVAELDRVKSKTLALASEADSANSVARTKSKTLGLGVETSSVPRLGIGKTLGAVTGTDAVAGLGRGKAQTLGAVSGTESVTALARTKSKTVETVSGSDSALALDTGTPTFGLISSADEPHSISRVKQAGIATVSEIGLANALSHGFSVGLANEIGNAGSLGSAKAKTLGLVSALDTAKSVSVGQPTFQEIGSVSETSVCLEIGRLVVMGDGPLTDAVPFLVSRGNRYR